MKLKWTTWLVSGALAAGGSAVAAAQTDESTIRIAQGPGWNLAAAQGECRMRVWVDDRARLLFRGDQVVVRTQSGRRSESEGTVCNQPLPLNPVADFRVVAERGRGSVFDVEVPHPDNNYTGALTIDDPQNGGADYEIVVAWRNPGIAPVGPVAAADPYPGYDEVRACQERVRGDFLARNLGSDAYLEFTSVPVRDAMGPRRDRIRGEAWARNRIETRPITYECVVNERSNRVVSASYEVIPRPRYSSLY